MSYKIEKQFLIAKQQHFSAARYAYKKGFLSAIDSFAFGANYHMWVGVTGSMNLKTGLVLEINQLGDKVKGLIDTKLDHFCYEKQLNKKLSLFDMGNWIWDLLTEACDNMKLSWLKLSEGPYWVYEKYEAKQPICYAKGLLKQIGSEEEDGFDFLYPITCKTDVLLNTLDHFKARLLKLKPTLETWLLNKVNQDLHMSKDTMAIIREMPSFLLEGPLYSLDFRPFGMVLSFSYDLCLQHSLNVASLSQEENEKLFGACVRLHGHSLKVILSLYCLKLEDVNELLNQYNLAQQHIKALQFKLNQFCELQKDSSTIPLSCECLLNWLLDQAELKMLSLAAVKIYETPRNMFEWKNTEFV